MKLIFIIIDILLFICIFRKMKKLDNLKNEEKSISLFFTIVLSDAYILSAMFYIAYTTKYIF